MHCKEAVDIHPTDWTETRQHTRSAERFLSFGSIQRKRSQEQMKRPREDILFVTPVLISFYVLQKTKEYECEEKYNNLMLLSCSVVARQPTKPKEKIDKEKRINLQVKMMVICSFQSLIKMRYIKRATSTSSPNKYRSMVALPVPNPHHSIHTYIHSP